MRDYTAALELNPKYVEAYNNRANAYLLLGQFDRALLDYDTAIKLDPRNARIYGNRGVVKLRQGNAAGAKNDFKKSIELDPSLKEKIEPLLREATNPPVPRR